MGRRVLLFVLLVACHRGGHADLFCGRLGAPKSGDAINPLLDPNRYFCFDDAATCDKRAVDCVPVEESTWACFATEPRAATRDPLAGITECFPTMAMCEASRPRTLGVNYRATSCEASDAVYCRTSDHGVACTRTESDCNQVREFEASVLHDPAVACAKR